MDAICGSARDSDGSRDVMSNYCLAIELVVASHRVYIFLKLFHYSFSFHSHLGSGSDTFQDPITDDKETLLFGPIKYLGSLIRFGVHSTAHHLYASP